jgi:hypothetical protein
MWQRQSLSAYADSDFVCLVVSTFLASARGLRARTFLRVLTDPRWTPPNRIAVPGELELVPRDNTYRGSPKCWTHLKQNYVFCDVSVREKDWRGKPGL